jgi:hypothetical protein
MTYRDGRILQEAMESARLGESVFTGVVTSGPEEPLVTSMDATVHGDRVTKANALLVSLLDLEQLEMFHTHACFVVVGGETGDHYFVSTTYTQGNVMCINTGQHLCLVPAERSIPAGDQFAAQLLMIRCEEVRFKAQANRLGCFHRDLVERHILGTLRGDESLTKSILEAAPERYEEPEPRRYSNVFEAAMPSIVMSQRMYNELDNLGWVERGEPQWNPGSSCHCPSCEEARERYALERGREMERMRERELMAISTNPASSAEAVRHAERELYNLRSREPPQRWTDSGRFLWEQMPRQNNVITITPIAPAAAWFDAGIDDDPPPYAEPWRYHIRGELNPRAEWAIRVLRDRGMGTDLEYDDLGGVVGQRRTSFEMVIAFHDPHVLDEVRYLFGV